MLTVIQGLIQAGFGAAADLLAGDSGRPRARRPRDCRRPPCRRWPSGFAQEHPEFHCRQIDLDPASPPDELPALADELLAASSEPLVAFQDRRRLVARLARPGGPASAPLRLPTGPHYRLGLKNRGSLDGLRIEEFTASAPEAGRLDIVSPARA